METEQRCPVPGCDQSSGPFPKLDRMCFTHFIKSCYRQLEEMNRTTHTWSVGGAAWESARLFVHECAQRAASFTREKPELSNLERAQLADISMGGGTGSTITTQSAESLSHQYSVNFGNAWPMLAGGSTHAGREPPWCADEMSKCGQN